MSHGVENGNQDAPSPPPDKTKALSNLAPILHRGPADHSALAITVYCKTAMVELQAYAATVVAQGDSVMKKDVRRCGEIAKGFVGRIEHTLGPDLKLFKISPAQKKTLDRAWAKIEDTTPNHAQSLDKWCQGAKNVMDDLAFEGYAQATGCILVIKDLVRKIQELSTAHQDPPQKSEGTPVVVSRKLQEDPPIEIGIVSTMPLTVSGDTATGSVYPSLEFQCFYFGENAVLYSFEAPSAVILDLEDLDDSSLHDAVVIDQAGDCIYFCPSFSPCAFLTTPGQTYRILVFDWVGEGGGFQFTIRSEDDIVDPETIQLEGLPATISGNTDLPSNGGTGGLYTQFFGFPCEEFRVEVDFLGVLHTFVASDPITRFETCGSLFDTSVLVFNQDGSCLGGEDRFVNFLVFEEELFLLEEELFVSDDLLGFGDDDGCSFQEDFTLRTIPGQTYFVLVTSAVRTAGPYTLRVTGIPEPESPESPESPSPPVPSPPAPSPPPVPSPSPPVPSPPAPSPPPVPSPSPPVPSPPAPSPPVPSPPVPSPPAPSPPVPSPPVSSPSWCEKITPLKYSLSGKGKKKVIKECLKYDLIGDSALPEEIGQIGLTSPGMLGLAGGVGLMALVAVLAVVLKRRVPAEPHTHWLPVPEVE